MIAVEPAAEPPGDTALQRAGRAVLMLTAAAAVLALSAATYDPAAPIKTLAVAAGAAAMALLMAAGARSGPWTWTWTPSALLLLAWSLWGAAAAGLAPPSPAPMPEGYAPPTGLEGPFGLAWAALLPMLIGLALLGIAPGLCRTPRAAARMAAAIVIAVALSSVYGFLQAAGLDPFPWAARDIEEYRGLPATYGNPNFAGHVLVLSIPLAAMLALQRGTRWALLPLLLMLAHLERTHMRAGPLAIAAALGLLAIAWAVRRRVAQPLRAAVVAVLIAVLCGGALAGGALALHRAARGTWLPSDGSLVLRFNGYLGAARMALTEPLSGYGPGRYVAENPWFWTPYEQRWFAAEGRMNDHVHNEPLEAAVDGGFPMAALYLALMAYAVLAALHLAFAAPDPARRRLGYALTASFAGFAVDGLFGFNLRLPASAFLFFMLLAALEGQQLGPPPGARRRLARAAAAIVFTGLLDAAAWRAWGAEQSYQQARGALVWAEDFARRGGYEEAAAASREQAIALAGMAAHMQPWEARHAHGAGEAAYAMGNGSLAARWFAAAVRLAPHDPVLRASLALALLMQRAQAGHCDFGVTELLLEQAETEARVALDRCAGYPPAAEVLGRVAIARAFEVDLTLARAPAAVREAETRRRATDAAAWLETALRGQMPHRAELHELRARALALLGRPAEAAEALRRAVAADPARVSAWDRLARAARDAGAARVYRDALTLQAARPEDRGGPAPAARNDLRRRLAEVYLAAPDEAALAAPLMRSVLESEPDDPADWGRFALAFPPAQRAEALAAQAAAAPARPAMLDALLRALGGDAAAWPAVIGHIAGGARSVVTPGPIEGAVAAGWAADLLEPQLPAIADPALRMQAAAAAAAARAAAADWPAARTLIEPLLAAAPLSLKADLLTDYAAALAGMGERDAALAQARAARQAGASRPHVRLGLARRLAEAGRCEEARAEYEALDAALRRGAREAGAVAAERAALMCPDEEPAP